MKTSTKSTLTDKTTLLPDEKCTDGGKALLAEAFDFIHEERQVGKLSAQFGPGGVITAMYFEETQVVPQKNIGTEV